MDCSSLINYNESFMMLGKIIAELNTMATGYGRSQLCSQLGW